MTRPAMTSTTWKHTTAAGLSLAVEEWPASPDAPVVLAVHGITANRLSFAATADALAGTVRLLAVDLRGRGRSDKPLQQSDYGMRRHAEDVADLLRAVTGEPIVLVGHSMGTWVCEQVAAHHPELVKALVLVDGGYGDELPQGIEPEQVLQAVLGPVLARLSTVVPSREDALAVWRSLPCFAGEDWSGYVETYLDEDVEDVEGGVIGRCSPAAAAGDYLSLFDPAIKGDLASISAPAALLLAPKGFCISPETEVPLLAPHVVTAFQAAVPQLQVSTVPDVNHYTIGLSARGGQAIADAVRVALA